MAKRAANTMKTVLCSLKLFKTFSIVSDSFEQMKSYTPKNTGASISGALIKGMKVKERCLGCCKTYRAMLGGSLSINYFRRLRHHFFLAETCA